MTDSNNSILKKLQALISNRFFVVITALLLATVCFFLLNYAVTCFTTFTGQIIEMVRNKTELHVSLPNFFAFDSDVVLYIILAAVSTVCSIRIVYLLYKCWRPLDDGQKGSRRFSDLEELKKQYRSIPEKEVFFDGKGGFPVSRYNHSIFIDDSPVNNMVVGTTRSGKGELIVFPMIDIYSRAKKLRDRASMVITDPKGELAASSKALLESRGYQVLIFDLIQFQGLSYNPLSLVTAAYQDGDTSTAQLLANTLSHILFHEPSAKDKTWENWSISLTNALIFAIIIDHCEAAKQAKSEEEKQAYYNNINLYSVARLLIDLGQSDEADNNSDKNNMDRFFANREPNDIARMQYASVEAATGKTKGNIYANTLAVLTKFTFDNIAKMTALNNIDLVKIGFDAERPTAVFLTMPDYDTSNHFLVTIFISQLYFVLSKEASLTPAGSCTREVIFILDEFGNITPIPNLSNIVTVCLGRNIRFTLIIQAYSQIAKNYGNEDAKTIIGNCGNQVYILTIELETARQFAQLIGNQTITVFSRSGDPLSVSKHFQEHIESKPLLDANELMEFLPGENVVVRVTKRTDLKGNKVKPNPIYNHNETIMRYRYEYLNDFDMSKSFSDLNCECLHKDLSISDVAAVYPRKETFRVMTETGAQISPPEQREESKSQLFTLLDLPTLHLIQQLLGDGMDDDWQLWSVDQFEQALQHMVEEGDLTEVKYDDIRSQLQNSLMDR